MTFGVTPPKNMTYDFDSQRCFWGGPRLHLLNRTADQLTFLPLAVEPGSSGVHHPLPVTSISPIDGVFVSRRRAHDPAAHQQPMQLWQANKYAVMDN